MLLIWFHMSLSQRKTLQMQASCVFMMKWFIYSGSVASCRKEIYNHLKIFSWHFSLRCWLIAHLWLHAGSINSEGMCTQPKRTSLWQEVLRVHMWKLCWGWRKEAIFIPWRISCRDEREQFSIAAIQINGIEKLESVLWFRPCLLKPVSIVLYCIVLLCDLTLARWYICLCLHVFLI